MMDGNKVVKEDVEKESETVFKKVGAKAYNFYGKIMIFTPENELYQFNSGETTFPEYKVKAEEIDFKNDTTYNITFQDFTKKEISKLHLITGFNIDGFIAYVEGEKEREVFYWNPIEKGTKDITISKKIIFENNEELLAKYYHNSESYEYYGKSIEGNEYTFFVDYQNNIVKSYINSENNLITEEFTINNINKNPENFKVVTNDIGEEWVAQNAKRIECLKQNNEEKLYLYIQDGYLYFENEDLNDEQTNYNRLPLANIINSGAFITK